MRNKSAFGSPSKFMNCHFPAIYIIILIENCCHIKVLDYSSLWFNKHKFKQAKPHIILQSQLVHN